MKVVLFCGGLGLRMRSDIRTDARPGHDTGPRPKPMMTIGDRPVLWHVMRYYAHFGHTEFVLCLGYGAQAVKDYFLEYRETASNDFVLSKDGQSIELLGSDISDWRITFVDTGVDSAIGERLRRVRDHLGGDEMFLANYGDVLTDAPIDEVVERVADTDAVGSLLVVRPQQSFHVVDVGADARIAGFQAAADMGVWINGGYFVLRQDIFDYLEPGDDLVMHGCARAARDGRMLGIRHDGFWAPMDTLKERALLEDLHLRDLAPWELWRADRQAAPLGVLP